jgi:hypothetical protein
MVVTDILIAYLVIADVFTTNVLTMKRDVVIANTSTPLPSFDDVNAYTTIIVCHHRHKGYGHMHHP